MTLLGTAVSYFNEELAFWVPFPLLVSLVLQLLLGWVIIAVEVITGTIIDANAGVLILILVWGPGGGLRGFVSKSDMSIKAYFPERTVISSLDSG